MLCKNLYAEKSELMDDDGNPFMCSSLVERQDMQLATSDEIWRAMRRLEGHLARARTKNEADLRQQAAGFTFNAFALLMYVCLDGVLDPKDNLMHDWMHACFVHGVWNTCVHRLMTKVSDLSLIHI